MKRALDVVRIQAVNGYAVLGLPVLVLAVSFLASLAIFAVVESAVPDAGDGVTGGLLAIYGAAGVTHLQTMTQVFPFAVGLSVTRRAFYAGTMLVVLAQSALFGLLLTAMEGIERATGGWGMRLRFFGVPYLVQGDPVSTWAAFTVPSLLLSATAVAIGVVFKRWGQIGIWTGGIGSAVLLAGAVILVTWRDWWPAVGAFFVDTPSLALFAGYPLVIAVVVAGAGWFALRRAVP